MRAIGKRRILCIALVLGLVLSIGVRSAAAETPEKGAVARVESTGMTYATLQEAIDAAHSLITSGAHDAQTVTLLQDTAESVSRVWTKTSVDYDYTLTVDLNGHTVTGTNGSVLRFAARGSGGAAYGFHVLVRDSSEAGTGTITGGTGTPTAFSGTDGGGIYFDGTTVKDTLTVENVHIVKNTATGNGGAIAMGKGAAAHLILNGGTISDNTASNGGAIFGRWVTVDAVTITGNSATVTADDSQSGSGGAIYMWGSGTQELTLGDSARIYGNFAERLGDDIVVASIKGKVTYDIHLNDPAEWNEGIESDIERAWYVDGFEGVYTRDTADTLTRYDANSPKKLESYTVTKRGIDAPAYMIAVKQVGFTPKPVYTVTVDPANGDAAYTVTLTHGDTIGDAVKTPSRAGYTFAGWVDENGNSVAVSGKCDGSFTKLTATWTANVYTITFDANGGKVQTDTRTVTYDSPVGELPISTRRGYTFIAWQDAQGKVFTADTLYTVAGDLTLYAQWEANAVLSPITGAGSGILFWICLSICGVGLLFVGIHKNRKRRKKS